MDLVDPFGRTIRDLRISITDRCNFRCTYCMPEEGMKWLTRPEVLTYEEIERVTSIFVNRFGVRSVRLTGGEPTVRAHLPVLVEKLARIGLDDFSITTNGSTFKSVASDLFAAGLQRANISLDTLKRDRFEQMTRRDDLDNVLAGIDAAFAGICSCGHTTWAIAGHPEAAAGLAASLEETIGHELKIGSTHRPGT